MMLLAKEMALTLLMNYVPHDIPYAQSSPVIIDCTYHLITNETHSVITLSDKSRTNFILTLASKGAEIEQEYISNYNIYNRFIQYLNYDIAQDVYLLLPGRPDSVAAIAASYPRQYGATGRSSVLLTFPVSDKQLRHGCAITFKGEKLAVGTHRFVFTAADIKTAHKAPRPTY